DENNCCARSPSSARADLPSAYAAADAPTSAGVFGITRITRAPASSPPSSLASGTPAAIEIKRWSFVKLPRISCNTPATWSGLTASNSTLANFTTSRLDALALAPTSRPKAAQAAATGSLAIICSGVASPARTKPRASAMPILPAPRKPIVRFADMPRLVTVHPRQRKPKGKSKQLHLWKLRDHSPLPWTKIPRLHNRGICAHPEQPPDADPDQTQIQI